MQTEINHGQVVDINSEVQSGRQKDKRFWLMDCDSTVNKIIINISIFGQFKII